MLVGGFVKGGFTVVNMQTPIQDGAYKYSVTLYSARVISYM